MHTSSRSKGTQAELVALAYLQQDGFSLVEQNFSTTDGEIDLIMRKDDFLVFIEVKSIKDTENYSIYDRLTETKKKRIRKSIDSWLNKNDLQECIWRFDYVGIAYSKDRSEFAIEHFDFIDL